jgi:hypothetical protein
MRIQTIMDIKTSSFLKFHLSPYTRNDQAAASDVLATLKKGDLVIRDLGYYAIPVMKKIAEFEAYFLSKYQFRASLLNPNTQKPMAILKTLRKYGHIDRHVLVGTKERMRMRFIAVQLPKKEARRRKAKLKNHPDRRQKPSKEQLALCRWAIFLTNVPVTVLSPENICKAYGLRWHIEIIFKTWKSHCHLTNISPYANKALVEATIYAKLIYILFFFEKLLRPITLIIFQKTGKYISVLKLMKFVNNFWSLVRYQGDSNEYWIEILVKHCTYEERWDRINYPRQLTSIKCKTRKRHLLCQY